VTPGEFEFLAGFLRRRSGISLTSDKTYLFQTRLVPVLSAHRLSSISDVIRALNASTSGPLHDDVVDAMTTNETLFFRDRTPFDLLKSHLLPKLVAARAKTGVIRIWSAAASTGQEAYSLAMLCTELRPMLGGMRIEIVGTDLCQSALARAEQGRYNQFEVQRGLPISLLAKYFTKEGDDWVLAPSIRAMVQFRRFNLLDPLRPLGRFDVVFCRNVLIYFDLETKRTILGKIAEAMADDGTLFLGAAETVLGITDRFAIQPDLHGAYIKTKAG